ncbi:hypothetical protein E0S44_14755 [Salmonella enterica subsp. enterica serovar Orion]|nr:hypothetical protein [Salmonella enterica subsp. enterica serovar Orion]
MTVEKINVLSFIITGAERLDPVRVMIENYEPGKGRITITCYGKAWTAAWFAMGGDTVQEIIKLRRQKEIDAYKARKMWDEAETAEDVKANCCDYVIGNELLNLFGDDPWYAKWPSVPNPEYQYLDRVINAVRDGMAEMERAA